MVSIIIIKRLKTIIRNKYVLNICMIKNFYQMHVI